MCNIRVRQPLYRIPHTVVTHYYAALHGVGLSVALSVCQPCKNGRNDRVAICVPNSGGPNERRIKLGSAANMGRGNFEGENGQTIVN